MADNMKFEFENFLRYVRMMRQAQSAYFRTKGDRALKDAKDMERRVDDEVERLQKKLAEEGGS